MKPDASSRGNQMHAHGTLKQGHAITAGNHRTFGKKLSVYSGPGRDHGTARDLASDAAFVSQITRLTSPP